MRRDQLTTIKRSRIQNNAHPTISHLRLSNSSSKITMSLRKHRQTLANKRRGKRKNPLPFFSFFLSSSPAEMDRSKSPNPKLRGGNRKRRRVGGELNSRTIPGRAASGNERERIRRVCRLQPRFRVSNGARPRSRKPR